MLLLMADLAVRALHGLSLPFGVGFKKARK
jgi:hypothetical protein